MKASSEACSIRCVRPIVQPRRRPFTPNSTNTTAASISTPARCIRASATRRARSCCTATSGRPRRRSSRDHPVPGRARRRRLSTWSPGCWLTDLCAAKGIRFVLGHALCMKAIHGKAKNDRIDTHKIAVLLRSGILPKAYVYPAAMRATRDLLARMRSPLEEDGTRHRCTSRPRERYTIPTKESR